MKLKTLVGMIAMAVSSLYAQGVESGGVRENVLGHPVHVGNGAEGLTVKIIVGDSGDGITRMLIKALGPSLTKLGIAGALQDPSLEIHDENGTLATNNDWKEALGAEIEATGLAPKDDRESAVLITLGAGVYSAIVRGQGGAQGMAMVEAYIVK